MDISFKFLGLSFFWSCLFYFMLLSSKKSNSKLARFFYIPSSKSKTAAILLGGIVLSTVSILLAGFVFHTKNLEWSNDKYYYIAWACSVCIASVYGYLDDRYELRASKKMVIQLIAVFAFSIPTTLIAFNSNPLFSLILFGSLVSFGVVMVNGHNLLDGLDSLTAKMTSAMLIQFIAIGYFYEIEAVLNTACIIQGGVLAFYFFNKEPAKIHLGEIGGIFFGLSFLFLSFLSIKGIYFRTDNLLKAVSLGVIPLGLSTMEVAISFCRRIYYKKAPFGGDRLHIHHVLKMKYNLSASHTSSVLALSYVLMTFPSHVIAYSFGPVIGTLFCYALITCAYVKLCKKTWDSEFLVKNKNLKLSKNLKSKSIEIIDFRDVLKFQFSVIEQEQEQKKVA